MDVNLGELLSFFQYSIDSNIPSCIDSKTVLDWFDFDPVSATHPDFERIGLLHAYSTSFLFHDQQLYCKPGRDSSIESWQMSTIIRILLDVSKSLPSTVSGRLNLGLKDYPLSYSHEDDIVSDFWERENKPATLHLPEDLYGNPNKMQCPAKYPKFIGIGEPLRAKYPLEDNLKSTSIFNRTNAPNFVNDEIEEELQSFATEIRDEGQCPYTDVNWPGADVMFVKHIPNYRYSTNASWTRERHGITGGFPSFYVYHSNMHMLVPQIAESWSTDFEYWLWNFEQRKQKLFWTGSLTNTNRLVIACKMHGIVKKTPKYAQWVDTSHWFVVSNDCMSQAQKLEKKYGCLARDICKQQKMSADQYNRMVLQSKYSLDIGGWGPYAIRLKDMMVAGSVIISDTRNNNFEQIYDGPARRRDWFYKVPDGDAQAILDLIEEIETNPLKKLESRVRAYLSQRWSVMCFQDDIYYKKIFEVIVQTVVSKVNRIPFDFFHRIPNPNSKKTQHTSHTTSEPPLSLNMTQQNITQVAKSPPPTPESFGWVLIGKKGISANSIDVCLRPRAGQTELFSTSSPKDLKNSHQVNFHESNVALDQIIPTLSTNFTLSEKQLRTSSSWIAHDLYHLIKEQIPPLHPATKLETQQFAINLSESIMNSFKFNGLETKINNVLSQSKNSRYLLNRSDYLSTMGLLLSNQLQQVKGIDSQSMKRTVAKWNELTIKLEELITTNPFLTSNILKTLENLTSQIQIPQNSTSVHNITNYNDDTNNFNNNELISNDLLSVNKTKNSFSLFSEFHLDLSDKIDKIQIFVSVVAILFLCTWIFFNIDTIKLYISQAGTIILGCICCCCAWPNYIRQFFERRNNNKQDLFHNNKHTNINMSHRVVQLNKTRKEKNSKIDYQTVNPLAVDNESDFSSPTDECSVYSEDVLGLSDLDYSPPQSYQEVGSTVTFVTHNDDTKSGQMFYGRASSVTSQ